MRYITDKTELALTEMFMELAAKEAKKSTCKKSKRGAVIIKQGSLLGLGHNKVTFKKACEPCIREKIKDNSRVELCGAIHAKQMAILNAAMSAGRAIKGARMFHIEVKNGKMRQSGPPSCTVCARLICEAEIEFVLWHKDGYALYQPEEFNKLSFDYFLRTRQIFRKAKI